jgi:hypothetical protein
MPDVHPESAPFLHYHWRQFIYRATELSQWSLVLVKFIYDRDRNGNALATTFEGMTDDETTGIES